MSDDKVDGLLRIAEHKSLQREERRKLEWRVSFGLWTIMAATAISLHGYLKQQPSCMLLFCVLVVAALHAGLWIWPNYIRNEKDGRLAFYLAGRAEHLITGDGPPEEPRPTVTAGAKEFCNFVTNPITNAEIAITLLLGVAIILISRFANFALPISCN